MFKCGFISIVGRPNAGKSTLINAILKDKIAIMSDKAQTTRDNIMGILTKSDVQYIFIDTPGIHKPHHQLGMHLNRSAYQALLDSNVILWIVDGSCEFGRGDQFVLDKIKENKQPCILIVNKIDLLKKDALLEVLKLWNEKYDFSHIIPISAKKEDNIEEILRVVKDFLPESTAYFPDDMNCDHNEIFMIQEIIREKALWKTQQEIPHSLAVVIERIEEDEFEFHIYALIIVERKSQKSIVIGKQGQMIRSIRMLSQKELKKRFHKKVNLELYVRVEENWRNKKHKLQQFGYQDE